MTRTGFDIMRYHRIELTETGRACLTQTCNFGFMAANSIRELGIDFRATDSEAQGLDKEVLVQRLGAGSFADLVAVIEDLRF